jgi:hypothetical protein
MIDTIRSGFIQPLLDEQHCQFHVEESSVVFHASVSSMPCSQTRVREEIHVTADFLPVHVTDNPHWHGPSTITVADAQVVERVTHALAKLVMTLVSTQASTVAFVKTRAPVTDTAEDDENYDVTLLPLRGIARRHCGVLPLLPLRPARRVTWRKNKTETSTYIPMFVVLLTPGATLKAAFSDGTRVCIERGDGTLPTAPVTLLVTLLSDDTDSELWHALGGTLDRVFFTIPCAAIMQCTTALVTVATLACEPPSVLVPVGDGRCLEGILQNNGFIRLDKLLDGAGNTVFQSHETAELGGFVHEDVYGLLSRNGPRYEAWLAALCMITDTLPCTPALLIGHDREFAEKIRRCVGTGLPGFDTRSAITPLTTLADAVRVALACQCFDAACELAHIQAACGEVVAEPVVVADEEGWVLAALGRSYNMLRIPENLLTGLCYS